VRLQAEGGCSGLRVRASEGESLLEAGVRLEGSAVGCTQGQRGANR